MSLKALSEAIYRGKFEIVKRLISIDPELLNHPFPESTLHSLDSLDLEYKDITAVHLAYLYANNTENDPIFHFILAHQQTDLDAIFFDYEHTLEKINLLHLAIINNDLPTVKRLCEGEKFKALNTACAMLWNGDLIHGNLENLEDSASEDPENDTGIIGQVWKWRDMIDIRRIADVTPLHLAGWVGNKAILDLLINAGADPESKDSDGQKPIDYLQLLKSAEITPLGSHPPDYLGGFSFCNSAKLDKDACDDLIKQLERTTSLEALSEAIFEGNFETVKHLISIDPELLNHPFPESTLDSLNLEYKNITPVHLAYLYANNTENDPIFHFILAHQQTDLNAIFFDYEHTLEKINLLHLAIINNDLPTVKRLCEGEKFRALNTACAMLWNGNLIHGNLENLEDWTSEDEDWIFKDFENDTGTIGKVWMWRDMIDIRRIADVTPLHLAGLVGNKKILNLLINAGADPESKDSDGQKPIDYLQLLKSAEITPLGSRPPDYLGGFSFCNSAKLNKDACDDLIEQLERTAITTPPKRKYLFLGEGDFSYTQALTDKHPKRSRKIIATEYLSRAQVQQTHGQALQARTSQLTHSGVEIKFEIDARIISQHNLFSENQRPQKIHFNFPHDKQQFKKRTLPLLLEDFFKDAAKLQKPGDQIIMALPKLTDFQKQQFYEAYIYNIFTAAAKSGYVCARKRPFGANRYPGYQHTITGHNGPAAVAETAREYTFKKTNLLYAEILEHPQYKPRGQKTAYQETNYLLPALETDTELSTDDSSSEEETETNSITCHH